MTELRRERLLGSLHGAGEGQRGGDGAVAREEEGKGGAAWWAGLACWASQGQNEGRLLGCLGRKLKEKSFQNKNWILNILGL
jgi:hypothetical protein